MASNAYDFKTTLHSVFQSAGFNQAKTTFAGYDVYRNGSAKVVMRPEVEELFRLLFKHAENRGWYAGHKAGCEFARSEVAAPYKGDIGQLLKSLGWTEFVGGGYGVTREGSPRFASLIDMEDERTKAFVDAIHNAGYKAGIEKGAYEQQQQEDVEAYEELIETSTEYDAASGEATITRKYRALKGGANGAKAVAPEVADFMMHRGPDGWTKETVAAIMRHDPRLDCLKYTVADHSAFVATIPRGAIPHTFFAHDDDERADAKRAAYELAYGKVPKMNRCPLMLKILVAIHSTPTCSDYGPADVVGKLWNTKAGQEIRAALRKEGVVNEAECDLTRKGNAWLEAMLDTPLPVQTPVDEVLFVQYHPQLGDGTTRVEDRRVRVREHWVVNHRSASEKKDGERIEALVNRSIDLDKRLQEREAVIAKQREELKAAQHAVDTLEAVKRATEGLASINFGRS